MDKEKNMSQDQNREHHEYRHDSMIAVGITIGTGFGIARGLVIDTLAIGIAIGANSES